MLNRILQLCFVVVLVSSSGPARAADWPAFRGPMADGVVRDAAFDAFGKIGLQVVWKRTLGSGYSSVSVGGDRLFTQYSDGERDLLIAVERADGRTLWQFDMGETYVGHDGSHTGPLSTPLLHDGQVIALGPRGRLVSVSMDSGEAVWDQKLTETVGAAKPYYGFSTAPLVVEGVLLVQLGGEGGGTIAGFDPSTGERLWTVGTDAVQYQSPVPYRIGDRTAVVAAGDQKLFAVRPETGELLWEFEHGGTGARGVGSLMPVPAGEGRVFLAHRDEMSRVVRISSKDGEPTLDSVWESAAIRNSYNVPVYLDGYLYAYSSRFLTCVNAETGEVAWRSRPPGDGFLIVVGGHLVIQTKEGGLHVARATAEDGYQSLASVEVFEDLAWTPPSFSDGSIFVRSLGELARVDVVKEAADRMAVREVGPVDLTGTRFGAFLERLEAATDRQAAVDEFLESESSFPIVEGDLVHFVFSGEATDLALSGDMVGSRQEAPMSRVEGTNLFHRTERLAPDAHVSYAFVKDYKEALDPRNSRTHMSSVYGRDMEMIFSPAQAIWMNSVSMPGWQEPTHLEEAPEGERGSLETHKISSSVMERELEVAVYLPKGYADSERTYPVVYVNGGTEARQAGKLVNTLDALIGKTVEPVVAVFLDVPLPPPLMAKYGEVVADEVVPFIDENYRVDSSRDRRASLGMGFPGYGALLAAFSQPETFGRVGAISPLMLDSMFQPLEAIVGPASESPLEIYLDWGTYDMRNPHENWDLSRMLADFNGMLKERGYDPTGGEVPEGAGWSAYKSRTDEVLESLFPLGVDAE